MSLDELVEEMKHRSVTAKEIGRMTGLSFTTALSMIEKKHLVIMYDDKNPIRYGVMNRNEIV